MPLSGDSPRGGGEVGLAGCGESGSGHRVSILSPDYFLSQSTTFGVPVSAAAPPMPLSPSVCPQRDASCGDPSMRGGSGDEVRGRE